MSQKAVLILGAGVQQVPVIKTAKRLGYLVVSADINTQAPGLSYADYPLAGVSTHDSDALKIAIDKLLETGVNVAGVVAVAIEAAHIVAELGQHYDWPAVCPEVAFLSGDKLARISCFQQAGVPTAAFAFATTLEEALAESDKMGYPVVFKPTNLSGARGVVVIRSPQEAREWFAFSAEYNHGKILIEEYLEGTEHSSESLVVDGEIYTTGFSDRNYDTKYLYPPHLLENGDTLPTALPDDVHQKVLLAIEQAIRALGIHTGIAKGDILVTHAGEPKVIEMAARGSGDYFCTLTTPLHNGTDIVAALLQQSVSDPVDMRYLQSKFSKGVALRYVWPEPGEIEDISGWQEVKAHPAVQHLEWEPYWKQKGIGIGTEITPPTCHGERVASLMAVADDRDSAVRIAEEQVQKIRVKTRNVQKLSDTSAQ